MVRKKKAKKPSKKRRQRETPRLAASIRSSPEIVSPSPAAGVRLLRERIETSGASKKVRTKLTQALWWLEAEYERVQGESGLHVLRPRIQSVSSDEKRPALVESVAATAFIPPRPEVSFIPTPPELVEAMLKVAKVTHDDIVYDLGSGDGRIVIAAAKQYGARGVGIDIDRRRIEEATERAAEEGISDLVSFRRVDLFEAEIRDATVVTLYLLPEMNLKLRQRLLEQLEPGTRIVSHQFDMDDWLPEQTVDVDGRRVLLWIVPDRTTKLPDTT